MAVLGDYIRIKHGFAFKGNFISPEDNGVVLVTPGNFAIGGGFKEEKCKFFHAEYPDEYVLKPGDLIVTMTDLSKQGDTLGYSAKVPESKRVYLHNQRIGLVDVFNPNADKDYLYWFMRSKNYQKTVVSTASGSTVKHTSPSRICEIELNLPSIGVQKKIAEILSSFDSKIKLNQKVNENLERQAQTIFHEWFISSSQKPKNVGTEIGMLPAGFTTMKIGDLHITITDYVANGSFASLKANVRLYQEPNYAYFIRNTDLKSGTFEVFVDEHSYNFLSKSRLYGGEIIISNVGDVGSVFLCPVLNAPMTLGNNIIMLKPEKKSLKYYLYIWFKWSVGQRSIQGIKGGSAQPKFNKTDFKALPVILPPDDLLDKFHVAVSPMFDAIELRQSENRRLAALRDAILPKLMSSETSILSDNIWNEQKWSK